MPTSIFGSIGVTPYQQSPSFSRKTFNMAPSHLSIDEACQIQSISEHELTSQFLTRLTSLFESRRIAAHGSIFLTQKRRMYTPIPSAYPGSLTLNDSITTRSSRIRNRHSPPTFLSLSRSPPTTPSTSLDTSYRWEVEGEAER